MPDRRSKWRTHSGMNGAFGVDEFLPWGRAGVVGNENYNSYYSGCEIVRG